MMMVQDADAYDVADLAKRRERKKKPPGSTWRLGSRTTTCVGKFSSEFPQMTTCSKTRPTK